MSDFSIGAMNINTKSSGRYAPLGAPSFEPRQVQPQINPFSGSVQEGKSHAANVGAYNNAMANNLDSPYSGIVASHTPGNYDGATGQKLHLIG